MKILTVVGARPQFVKAAVVSRALRECPGAQEVLLHTGQHFDGNMSAIFFDELEIAEPDYNLAINGGTHGIQTGRMLVELDSILLDQRPDVVLVYGDTNSTLAGALAAAKLHIPVAHVEAGLRSYNRRMPEEINRVVTDQLSNALYTPTTAAAQNLAKEGIGAERIIETGDVMYDAARFYAERAAETSRILLDLGLTSREYVLATIHRAENTDDPVRLRDIFEGLVIVSEWLPVVLPLHPRTRAAMSNSGIDIDGCRNLKLIDPVGYLDMVVLEKHARVVATDSGGVQKEAFFFHVPCVTLRAETEWVELVQLGWNHLWSGEDSRDIADAIRLMGTKEMPAQGSPYGAGNAGEMIARHLTSGAL